MNESSDDCLRRLLRQALPPLGDAPPQRDLWPRVLRRLDERHVAVSGLDWVLAAVLLAVLLAFPQVIPSLLYHL